MSARTPSTQIENQAAVVWQQTHNGLRYLSAPDALGRHTPAPLRARYAVLGIPLEVATNAPCLYEMAMEAFAHWGAPDTPPSRDDLRLRLLLHDVSETLPGEKLRPLMRGQGSYFFQSVGQSVGFADRAAGCATAFLTPALVARPDQANALFVECLGLYLVCGRRSATLHAAGIAWNGRGVLLTGRDGAGKSTLAYACARAGAQFLAEDMVCLDARADTLMAWGDSRFLHLLPDAGRFFPELEGKRADSPLHGDAKLRVCMEKLRPAIGLRTMPVAAICSLERVGQRFSCLRPADPAHLRRVLTTFKGDPPVDQTVMQAAVDRLLTARTAHLEIGTDLDHAVETVRTWLQEE